MLLQAYCSVAALVMMNGQSALLRQHQLAAGLPQQTVFQAAICASAVVGVYGLCMRAAASCSGCHIQSVVGLTQCSW